MTKFTRFTKAAIAVFLVACLSIVFVPGAEAQTQQCGTTVGQPDLSVELKAPNGRIKPITEPGQLTATVVYNAPERAKSIVPIKITLNAKVENSGWATASVSPSEYYITIPENGGVKDSKSVTVTVALSNQAPAFGQQMVTLEATATEGTCVSAPPVASGKQLITADFYDRTQARFGKTIIQASQNDQVSIPLTIENFGNGAISVVFRKGEDTSKHLVLALPGLQIVPSTIAGGDTNKLDMTIDVKTPFKNGYENRQDELFIDISGTSADQTSVKLSQDLQVSAVIQTQGVYVPGFEAVTMLTALLGSVLAIRRLR